MPLVLDILAPILEPEPELTRVEFLLESLNSNPIFGWGIAIFVVLAMAAAAFAPLTENLSSISRSQTPVGEALSEGKG